MTSSDCICLPLAPNPVAHRLPLWRRIGRALALRRQRARLLLLEAHLLRDIGVTLAQAQAEAARPIWDAPPHWRDQEGANNRRKNGG